ncbi:hypothetical protein BKA70DRAFT_124411 [Coprinopsis sp. MPI-PUGE-AT-0042]|nr:hypothetical protein BKA70DRAFT_124411 [Coprinopsis sp. MPI-PUGE-AT-0042]
MEANSSPELPPELWGRILAESTSLGPDSTWYHYSDSRKRFAELSFVCRLFRAICQQILFKVISVKSSTGGWLERCHKIPYQPQYTRPVNLITSGPDPVQDIKLPRPVDERDWWVWKQDICAAIKAERRVTLIGEHPFLALQLQSIHINRYHAACPAEPLPRPSSSQALSRAVFDEQHRFRKTFTGPPRQHSRTSESCIFGVMPLTASFFVPWTGTQRLQS